jgi:hypothetical protein
MRGKREKEREKGEQVRTLARIGSVEGNEEES